MILLQRAVRYLLPGIGGLLVILWLQGTLSPLTAQAPTTVIGNGTAASCTESALDAALAQGGTITFDCGPSPVVIPITAQKGIIWDTILDGGSREMITLDARGRSRIFYVNSQFEPTGLAFTLRNITLANGRSGGMDPNYGGCLYNRNSIVTLSQVTVRGCMAVQGGGIFSYIGNLTILRSDIINNQASADGAGIISSVPGGIVTIRDSVISANSAAGNGGGIFINSAALTVQNSVIASNEARGVTALGLGGGIYTNKAGAIITIDNTEFKDNLGKEGGALFADLGVQMRVTRSRFLRNRGSVRGGGLGTYMARVVINTSLFESNQGGEGGAIFNGTQSVFDADLLTLKNNQAQRDGGGMVNASGTITVQNSSLLNNVAGLDGAGDTRGGGLISYNGLATIRSSTFANNRVQGSLGFGGGIGSAGPMAITNSTLTNNYAENGGALYVNRGTTLVTSSTLAGNSAEQGTAIQWERGVIVQLKNSIVVKGAVAGENCVTFGGIMSNLGNNVQQGDDSCFSGLALVDPLLRPLADNGGPTPTMALGAESPAIDAGDMTACQPTDQRGAPRVGPCDAGAFEASSQPPAIEMPHRVFFPYAPRRR